MIRAPTFSVVVTAPDGIALCDYLADWEPELRGHDAELIVVDGAEDSVEGDKGPARHCRFPGASLQRLMALGVKEARGEWVLITEDHCRPLAEILTAYARAIAKTPGADLVAGAADNLTSISPWSWAVFAIGLGEVWPHAPQPPRGASNANFLVRRSAVRDDELRIHGGVLNKAVPRLVEEGRFTTCPEAVVDHVVHKDRRTVVGFVHQVTREAMAEGRAAAESSPSAVADLWLSFKKFIGCALVVPLRTWRVTRNTPLATLPHRLRVAYICVTVSFLLAGDDLVRIFRQLSSRPVAPSQRLFSPPSRPRHH